VLADYIHLKTSEKQSVVVFPKLTDLSKEKIIERVEQAGIVGLGGAGFATAVKLSPNKPVDTLIINAAECEPYLNCDNRLMLERADEFIEGVRLLARALNVEKIIIGIENNKLEAYNRLLSFEGIEISLLKKKYPQGAEKTIIYACTKRKVPTGGLPMDVGVVVDNVATAYAVYDAVVNGRPLYKRVMTVSGKGIATPKNIEVLNGTPYKAIIDFCGGLVGEVVKLLSGGPMMGLSLSDDSGVTTKTDSGLLALTSSEANTMLPTPCINCGGCAKVCPMHLMPMYIDFYALAGDYETAVKYGAMNCFECGSCAFTCPAKRPLVQSIKLTKMKMKEKKK
ncbi:MAG: RnfABCDGE type electron transport complex subunit C, partial [Clostridia bacterium]